MSEQEPTDTYGHKCPVCGRWHPTKSACCDAQEPTPIPARRADLVGRWREAQIAVFEAEKALARAHEAREAALAACEAEGFAPFGDEVPRRDC